MIIAITKIPNLVIPRNEGSQQVIQMCDFSFVEMTKLNEYIVFEIWTK